MKWKAEGSGFAKRLRPGLPANPSAGDVRELAETVRDANTFEGWIREIEAEATAVSAALPEDAPELERPRHILKLIAIVRHALAEGRGDEAARYAAELGLTVREADLAAEHERDALRGAQNAETLGAQREKGNARRAADAERRNRAWIGRAGEIRAEKPSYSLWRIAGMIRAQLPTDSKPPSQRTIYEAIRVLSADAH